MPAPNFNTPTQQPMGGIVASVLDRVAKLGHTLHPTSRLALGGAAILHSISKGSAAVMTQAEHAALSAACRDFVTFEFILNAPATVSADPEFRSRLSASMRDGVLPADHGKQTIGRDTQLELFVAAAVSRAGLPVKFSTPDIRTRLENAHFYIEVKRPRSIEGIVEAVRTATKQIRKTGCPGTIYMDVSLAINPVDSAFNNVSEDAAFHNWMDFTLRKAMIPLTDEVERILHGHPITGVLIQWDVVRKWGPGNWMLDGQISKFINKGCSDRVQELRDLLDRSLFHGLPTTLRLYPMSTSESADAYTSPTS